jgi:hypothetical protein
MTSCRSCGVEKHPWPTHPVSRWLLKREYRRVESWERSALRKLDFVSPHSEKESHLLNALDSAVPQCPIQPWHTPAPDTNRITTPRNPFSVVFLLPRGILVAVVGLATPNLVAPEFIASPAAPTLIALMAGFVEAIWSGNRLRNTRALASAQNPSRLKRLTNLDPIAAS